MNIIRADMRCPQIPTTIDANIKDSPQHYLPALSIKCVSELPPVLRLCQFPPGVSINVPAARQVVVSVYGRSRASVKFLTVASNGD